MGMSQKAAKTTDPHLKQAYEEVIHIWTNHSGPTAVHFNHDGD